MSLTKETLRIMLVENDENDIFFVERALMKAGYTHELILVNSGRKAVDYFKRVEATDSSLFPHIVLMDIKMPGMDGFDVLRWMREESSIKDLPVIMLTSSDNLSDITKSKRLGIFKFLTKEVHYDNVISALDSFISSHDASLGR